jgi:very-short-patch-repair endonuclease
MNIEHESKEEQAQRDRSRDRVMTAQGTAVLRFTDSEVGGMRSQRRESAGVCGQACWHHR